MRAYMYPQLQPLRAASRAKVAHEHLRKVTGMFCKKHMRESRRRNGAAPLFLKAFQALAFRAGANAGNLSCFRGTLNRRLQNHPCVFYVLNYYGYTAVPPADTVATSQAQVQVM
jgi:hypothetical protein